MTLKSKFPKILNIETGFAGDGTRASPIWKNLIDYHVYDHLPKWWRKLEERLRLDIALAWEAKKHADQYDIIWAWSEKVGIPLTILGVRKPLIVVCHHPGSLLKKNLIRLFGLSKKWAAVGFVPDDDMELMMSQFHIPPERLFRCIQAPVNKFTPTTEPATGPIISLGVAKRDYNTFIAALSTLEGYETEIFSSSRYGDRLNNQLEEKIPEWIHFMGRVDDKTLASHFREARFVVLPLVETTQSSAGSTVALEAGAAGKAIIATQTAGTPSFIVDGKTGMLVPPGDVTALRNAIHYLWNNPLKALEMGQAARKFVETKFNPHDVDQRILSILQQVYCENNRSN